MRQIASLFFACIMIIPAAASAAPEKKGEQPPPMVRVTAVTLQNADRPEKFIGHVEALESVNLRARVQGYLEKVNFREGSFVRKGELLYVIEQAPYKARLASAKAKVAQAEAEFFRANTRQRRLRSANPESVPQTSLDDAKAAEDLARGKLREARANLELAEIDVDYTTVEAPISGRIGKSFYKQGDLVNSASGPLAEIVSIDPARVLFSVSEKRVDIIENAFKDTESRTDVPELTVRIQFPGKSGYTQEGRIAFLDNRMDADTGTIAVWARFDNPEGRLVPGQYVNVFLQSATPDMQPTVPQKAVQRDRDGDFVFVVGNESRVEKRRIQTGGITGRDIFVTSGLAEGDTVVVEGLQKVSAGVKVNAVTAEQGDG